MIILKDGVKYHPWEPKDEVREFEPMIIHHIKDIFGDGSEYFKKQTLTTLSNIRSIPDGFVVDFKNKKWYMVELKLLYDDAVRRISGQIVDYKNAAENLETRRNIYKSIKKINDDKILDELINDEKPEIIVIINSLDGEMGKQFIEKVKGTDKIIKIIEFKTFAREFAEPKKVHIHLFESMGLRTPAQTGSGKKVDTIGKKPLRRPEYRIPILESLIELGGKGKANEIFILVEKKLKRKLSEVDYEVLPSGTDIRWKNRAGWERAELVHEGFMKKDSPRGIWEITAKGRKYYQNNK